MKLRVYNLLKKFDILEILQIENSYFNSFPLRNNKKISKEVIELNYGEFSPYSNSEIYSKVDNNEIKLWYTDQVFTSMLVLPESNILLNYFVKNNIDGIVFIDTQPQKLLVIKEGALKRQISKNRIAQYEIDLIQKEFAIESCHSFDAKQYKEHFKKAIEAISIKDMSEFIQVDFDYKKWMDAFVQKAAVPISVFIGILIFIEGLNYLYVNDKLKTVESEYTKIKKTTQETRNIVNDIEDRSGKYTKLIKEFENNQKLITAMQTVSGIIKDANASFLFLRISENEFRIKVDTNQTSSIFTKIVNTGYFENLKIQSTAKNRRSPGEKVIIKGEVKW